jgi:hypothetical protein
MAIRRTGAAINDALAEQGDSLDVMASTAMQSLDAVTGQSTAGAIKEMLKHGTPDWFTHPEDYKDMAKEDYRCAKERSNKQVSSLKLPDQQMLTDERSRMQGLMSLDKFMDKLRKSGLPKSWCVDSPFHNGTAGLWVMAPTVDGLQAKFITTVQYPAMYEWSVLREDEHELANGEKYIGWRNAVAKLIEYGIWTEEKAHKVFGTPPVAPHTMRYRKTLWNARNNRYSLTRS